MAATDPRGELRGAVHRGDAAATLERDWDGDRELADQLGGRLGTATVPMLRPLPIDLDQLSEVLEGDPRCGGGQIDLRTGEIWPQFVFDDGLEMDDEDR